MQTQSMEKLNKFKETHKNHINSLSKNKEFMLNVSKLAELQLSKPQFQNAKVINDYNKAIEAQKGRIVMEAMAQIISDHGGIYAEIYVISSIKDKLLLAEHNQQINNFNKVGDIFRNFANSNKNELLEELGKLEQQEEAKEGLEKPVVPKNVFKQLFFKQRLQKVLALPEVKEQYDECLKFKKFNGEPHDILGIITKHLKTQNPTKDDVLSILQKFKTSIETMQNKKSNHNLSSSFSDGKESLEDNLPTSKNLQFGASHGLFAKVSNPKRPSILQKQQNSQGSMR